MTAGFIWRVHLSALFNRENTRNKIEITDDIRLSEMGRNRRKHRLNRIIWDMNPGEIRPLMTKRIMAEVALGETNHERLKLLALSAVNVGAITAEPIAPE